jgi:chemotaxis protein MotB
MARKKKAQAETKSDGLIQVMTISLFIILLAFFILLNSIATIDDQKVKKVMGSVVEQFGGERPTETSGTAPEEVFIDGVSPVDLADLTTGESGARDDISVRSTTKKTTLSIQEDLLFSGYATRINPQGRTILDKLVRTISTNDFPVDISGHTDDSPMPSDMGMNNRELSTLRSVTVMEYLVAQGSVPAERLTACGWGGLKPVTSNATARSRRLNRRIDVTFTHDKSFEKPKGIFIFKDFFFNVKDR